MDALKNLFEHLGFQNIKTFIQSGNIVYQSKTGEPTLLDKKIKKAIEGKFGFDVPVITLSQQDLKNIITENPFIKNPAIDPTKLHISFLAEKPSPVLAKLLLSNRFPPDEFHLKNNAVYLFCPDGYSNCKLTNGYLETKLRVTATTRNWKTSNQLLEIAENISNL
jgi:uncharacterized protein (DUF1697 family)